MQSVKVFKATMINQLIQGIYLLPGPSVLTGHISYNLQIGLFCTINLSCDSESKFNHLPTNNQMYLEGLLKAEIGDSPLLKKNPRFQRD